MRRACHFQSIALTLNELSLSLAVCLVALLKGVIWSNCQAGTTSTTEARMTKRKGKTVSFDAMVKFFMHNYNIPTKRDIDRIFERLDRLEKTIRASSPQGRRAVVKSDLASPASATNTVLNLIKNSPDGINVSQIREETGFDDKKLRNIIYRLNQMEKIHRVSRGHYKSKE
jgi:hypothetical protein